MMIRVECKGSLRQHTGQIASTPLIAVDVRHVGMSARTSASSETKV